MHFVCQELNNTIFGSKKRFYSPSPEYPAARRRHSGFGASATCFRDDRSSLLASTFGEFRFDTPQLVGVKRRSRFNGAAGSFINSNMSQEQT